MLKKANNITCRLPWKEEFSLSVSRVALFVVVGFVLLFLLLPIIIIPILSFGSSPWLQFPPPGWTLKWYDQLFSSSEWLIPILNSLKVAIAVVIVSQLLGIPISIALVRGKFPGQGLLNALFLTPMIMPYIIVAIAMYSLFLKLGLTGTFTGLIITHTILALPFVVINVTNSLRSVNVAIEHAALSCGANPLIVFWKITLPLIKAGVSSGAVFAFIVSWDEVIAAIFIADPTTMTLPIKIWSSLRLDLSPVIAAVSTILIVLSLIMLFISTSTKGSSDVFGGASRER
jgi:putative spermidine/putrescine transport system permease protein